MQVRIAVLLLDHGADATLEDEEGWTARQLATAQENQELLQLLDERSTHPQILKTNAGRPQPRWHKRRELIPVER